MRRPEGKVALVPGTARGLGKAAALRFAAEGALVVGGDLLHDEALETQREIGREGGTALTAGPLDVTRPESVEAWVAEAVEAFGGVDIVLTSAGSVRFGPLVEQSYDDYASTVRSELDSGGSPPVPRGRTWHVAAAASSPSARRPGSAAP
ncbi:SDR family oxidoreductase [Streptomyces sp. NPDC006368]|uniref:SDR family NAD(P)-dependent oxidoreductase n=1 Tax=Streptomyces sp. NPDC006368 TaxID=3156760 RepID=UPI0033AF45E8